MTLRYLPEAALAGLNISTQDIIASIEAMLRAQAAGRMWAAPKSVLTPPDGRYMMSTLAAADDPPLMAVKTLILNPRNAERGRAVINSLVTVLDSDTGEPVALLDGNWITAVRTAGLSAVSAQTMANPQSESVAFLGCGVQAQSHLRAFADMFPLKRITMAGRGKANIEALGRLAEELGLVADVAASPEAAMTDADIVVTSLTRAPDRPPFLDASLLKAGSFTAIVDLAEPWKQETFAAFDRIIIDDLQQEAAMAVKIAPPDLIHGDLSGLVLGRVPGRKAPPERTAFIFRGIALGDLALAALAYQRACAANVGMLLDT